MQSIFKIFQDLKKTPESNTDSFNVAPIPLIKSHKIGVSHNEFPMFFIKCGDSENLKLIDCNLEFISVQFNRFCQLINNKGKLEEGVYTIISLKADSLDLQQYFLDVVYLVIKKLPQNPNRKELKVEVEKLINLFSKFSQPAIKTIQGLWAELLVIEQSSDPDYLIQAWHSSVTDKFDFNDGKDKVEVKSTSKNRRIHSFSIEQLNPNKNSGLVIASVFAVETGIGESIFSLVDSIERKLKDRKLIFRLNEIIIQTLGRDIEKAFEIFYDYQLAIDSISYYSSSAIPSINHENIAKEVSNIRFDSDLTDTPSLKKHKVKSYLHKSLF
jgi:hypothetical protein